MKVVMMEIDSLYCPFPNLAILFQSIKFLRKKLDKLNSQINQEHESFLNYFSDLSIKNKEKQINDLMKEPFHPYVITDSYENVESQHYLFFDIDTFIIDIARTIEFTLKFIAKSEEINIKYPIGKFIGFVEENKKQEFYTMLQNKYSDYLTYLKSEFFWIKSINGNRVNVIHSQVSNKLPEVKITIFLSPDSDKIGVLPHSPIMFGKQIPIFIEENLRKLDTFLERSFDLKKELIKKPEVI